MDLNYISLPIRAQEKNRKGTGYFKKLPRGRNSSGADKYAIPSSGSAYLINCFQQPDAVNGLRRSIHYFASCFPVRHISAEPHNGALSLCIQL